MLQTGASDPDFGKDDTVLVWLREASGNHGVVLGRIGPFSKSSQPVVPPEEFSGRPRTQVIEAQGDIVLRNGHARIKLGASGEVEILCSSFTTRSHRLLRLLAPIIKLN